MTIKWVQVRDVVHGYAGHRGLITSQHIAGLKIREHNRGLVVSSENREPRIIPWGNILSYGPAEDEPATKTRSGSKKTAVRVADHN